MLEFLNNFFKKPPTKETKNYLTLPKIDSQNYLKRELVVAVYKDKIDWLIERKNKFNNLEKISAYNKFERNDFDYICELPNIGRESHTYLYHIIKNYNNLADFTTFVQGSPWPHLHLYDNPSIDIFYFNCEPIHDFYALGDFAMTNGMGRPFSHWDVNLFPIWERLFHGDMPLRFFANYGAQFIASKDLIRSRSLDFYKELMQCHEDYDFTPWALEIMWYFIFDPRFKSKF